MSLKLISTFGEPPGTVVCPEASRTYCLAPSTITCIGSAFSPDANAVHNADSDSPLDWQSRRMAGNIPGASEVRKAARGDRMYALNCARLNLCRRGPKT